jgi:hypothetical protein
MIKNAIGNVIMFFQNFTDKLSKIPVSNLSDAGVKYYETNDNIRSLLSKADDAGLFDIFTPKNAAAAKTEFLENFKAGTPENPFLDYEINDCQLNALEEIDDATEAIRKELNSFSQNASGRNKPADIFIIDNQRHVLRKLSLLIECATSISRRQDNKTTELINELYGTPSQDILKEASAIVEKDRIIYPVDQAPEWLEYTKGLEKLRLSANQTTLIIHDYVHRYYEGTNCLVRLTDEKTEKNITVKRALSNPNMVVVLVSNYATIKGAELILALSQVDAALYCARTARMFTLLDTDSLLYSGYENYLKKTRSSVFLGYYDVKDAYKIFAVDAASHGKNFVEVFTEILKHLPDGVSEENLNTAWDITLEVFSGCTETNNPNCFANTHARYEYEGAKIAENLMNGREGYLLNFAMLSQKQIGEITNIFRRRSLKTNLSNPFRSIRPDVMRILS